MAIVKLQNGKINADDTYTLTPGNGNARTLLVSGSFGSGTAIAGYINGAGNFIGFKDSTETIITFSADFQIVQDGGIGIKYAIDLQGSTAPNLFVEEHEHGR